MDNYTPNPFITQPIYDPTRPFATPRHGLWPNTPPQFFYLHTNSAKCATINIKY